MQFKVGDNVIHPAYGGGHIVQIEEKKSSEKEGRQYYKVILSRSTIWIPVEAQATVGLRLVTAKRDLDQYRAVIKSRPVLLNSSLPKQHVELDSRLKEGSFQTMCEVVRDLTASGLEKPLGATVKAILRKTQEKLYHEWATSADISIAEATKEIDTLLKATQEAALR